MGCYTESEIRRLLEQGDPTSLAPAFDQHLRRCATCLVMLDRLTSDPPLAQQASRTALAEPAGQNGHGEHGEHERPAIVPGEEPPVPFRAWGDTLKVELLRGTTSTDCDAFFGEGTAEATQADPAWPDIPGLEIRRQVGQGAMGVVYEAFDLQLKRRVALKMLSTMRQSDEALHRLRTEAEAAGRLSHPGIVQVYRLDTAGGRPCIVMEYVDGPTLAEQIAGRPQPPREAAALTLKLARALQYAHQRFVIHRDLKPSNILFEAITSQEQDGSLSQWRPKIADFGLAKVLDTDIDLTRDGQLIGTPTYAAPEQLGRPGAPVGRAADVYSLGAVLHTLLTGHPPLQGDDLWRTVQMVLEAEPVSPRFLQPGVPIDLETITLRCLMKEPLRRYADAGELADDLERFLADEPIRARPIGLAQRAWRWARRNPAVATSLTAFALLLTAATFAAIIAAAHFRGLVEERDQQRIAAELSLHDSRLALADSFRALGMKLQSENRHHLAAICFSEAATQLPADEPRRVDNETRAAAALQLTPRPLRLLGSPATSRLEDVAYHPSSRWLIAHPSDRSAPPILWDIEAASAMSFPANCGSVSALAWDRTGEKLIVGLNDGKVLVTSFLQPRVLAELQAAASIHVVTAAPDGTRIAAASGPSLWCWNLGAAASTGDRSASVGHGSEDQPALIVAKSGSRATEPRGESGPSPILDLAFSPDGRFLVAVSSDHRLLVIDADEPTAPPVLTTTCGVNSAGKSRILPAFDRRGRLIVWSDGKLNWFDLATGLSVRTEETPPAYFCEVSAHSGDVIVGADDHFILCNDAGRSDFGVDTRASACWLADGSVLTGSAESDCLIHWKPGLRDGQGWPLFQADGVRRLRPSPDGRLLTTISARNRLRVWEFPASAYEPIRIATTDAPAEGTFDSDAQHVLVRTDRFGARIHRTDDGSAAGPILRPGGHLVSASWWGDGTDVLTVTDSEQGCVIDVWDGVRGARRRPTIRHPERPNATLAPPENRVAVAPDGQRIAYITAAPHRVQLVSLGQFDQAPFTLPLPARTLFNAPDANRLVVVVDAPEGGAPEVVVVDWGTGAVIGRHPIDGAWVARAITSDRLLAYRDPSKRIRFLDPASGQLLPMIVPNPLDASPESLSDDGKRLLTRGPDRYHRLWDIAGGKLVTPPLPFAKGASATLAAGGAVVVAIWDDLSCHILSTHDGQPLCPPIRLRLDGEPEVSDRVTFSTARGGKLLAVNGLEILLLIDLEALLGGSPEDATKLLARSHLASGHRFEYGQPIPMDTEDWDARWRAMMARPAGK